MPQGDYEGALKRALHISAGWLKIFNAGGVGMGMLMQDGWVLMQTGWDAATVLWLRFYYTNGRTVDVLLNLEKGHINLIF